MQKKWVELFEKVIGRKPSPEEFMAGKACGFDLKKIQSIAGNVPAEEVAPVEESVVEPVEEVKNVDPLLGENQKDDKNMHNIVRKHIEGEISMDEVRRLIDEL